VEEAVHARLRELQDHHWWFEGRRRILSEVIASLRPPAGARILEVGCGAGGNLKMLRRFGDVAGLEPDAGARRHASGAADAEIREGALPDRVPFDDESFDLVCAFDVIEHVDDDRSAVARLATLVRPGGYVVATVPAYQWMWSAHDAAHHHKRRYRRAPFERLFRDAGLTVVRSSHFNTLLLPLAVLTRGVKRLAHDDSADDAMPAPWINAALLRIMGSERGWVRRSALPWGLSILVVARRDA
jgi:SAM-dependent methyltransferase